MKKRARRIPWSPDEDQVIRKIYPLIGISACYQHLTGRSEGAIRARACTLMVRKTVRKPYGVIQEAEFDLSLLDQIEQITNTPRVVIGG